MACGMTGGMDGFTEEKVDDEMRQLNEGATASNGAQYTSFCCTGGVWADLHTRNHIEMTPLVDVGAH